MKLGTYFTRRGQRYRYDLVERLTRDYRVIDVARLTTQCATCARLFSFDTRHSSLRAGIYLRRRCDLHRNPGVPVRRPVKRAEPSRRLIAAKRRREAEYQRALAAKREAEKQRSMAQAAKREAEEQRRIAQAAKKEAEEQRQRAQRAKVEAKKQREIARAAEALTAKQAQQARWAEVQRRRMEAKQKTEEQRTRTALNFIEKRRQIVQARLRRAPPSGPTSGLSWLD
jgi:flagellar biosynthesis GTPase FlhF